MVEVLFQLFGDQLQRLKKEYASLLGMLFASAFLAKWLDPHMLKYLNKAWTLIEKKSTLSQLLRLFMLSHWWERLGELSVVIVSLFCYCLRNYQAMKIS